MRQTKNFMGTMSLCWIVASAFALTGCLDNKYEMSDMIPGGQGGSQGSVSTGSESVSDLVNFTVAFDDTDEDTYGNMEETVVTDSSADGYEDFVENYTFSTTVTVDYDGTSATVSGLTDGITVTQDGAHVVVNSTLPAVEYVLAGSTDDGSFKVYSDEAFRLALDGVSLHNPQGAAINIQSKVRAFVTCEEGTSNYLTDGEEYVTVDGEDMKACLFSEGGLIFGGTGALSVTGNYNHAITSDKHIRFRAGCRVTVQGAENDGIHTNDQITIGGGIVYVTSVGDAMQCGDEGITMSGGFIRLAASDEGSDGLKAETGFVMTGGSAQVEITGGKGKGVNCAEFNISGGKLTILNSGGAVYDEDDNDVSSAAGIKCDGNVEITGGLVALQSTGAAGKGINCDGDLSITGGTVQVITTGSQYVLGELDSSAKGIKADGNLTISGDAVVQVMATGGEGSEGIESKSTLQIDGGKIVSYCYDDAMNASDAIIINGGTIYCHSTGNDAIDSNGTLTITGGLTIAVGTSTPEGGIDCDENTFSITGGTVLGIGGDSSTPTSSACTQPSFLYSGSISSGQLLHLESSDGVGIFTFLCPAGYSTMTLLYSSPDLQRGSSYVLYGGGSVSGDTEFGGYYTDATYTDGTQLASFTLSSMVTSIGNSGMGGGGNMGNRP